MIINRATQYTLQALMHLVAHADEGPVLARELAERLDLPQPYLAKLLQGPCRAGWLTSIRGRGGGFVLNAGTECVTLFEIVTLMQGEQTGRECLLGFKECNDETACVMHRQWKPIKQQILERFGRWTLAELASHAGLPSLLADSQAPRRKPAH